MSLKKIFLSSCVLAILGGCGQSSLNVPAGQETKSLFSLKSSESLGDKFGNIALNDAGILLHPGEKTPTTIAFNLDGKVQSIGLRPLIAPLDEIGKSHPEAGIVGVEILLDGKSIDKFKVDRNFSQEKNIETKGVKTLEVRVDNGNGTPVWDWFHMKVTSIK